MSIEDFNRSLADADLAVIMRRINEIKMPKAVRDNIIFELTKLSRYFAKNTFDVMNALNLNRPNAFRGRYSDVAISWDLLDPKVVQAAIARGGAMISSNIMTTTKDRIQEKVVQAIQRGDSIGKLKQDIIDAGIFSDSRAEMIARTETAIAAIEGRQQTMIETMPDGMKEWILSPDACVECEPFGGVIIPIDEDFEEGDPPLHPNCRCDLVYWTSEEAQDRSENEDKPILELGS